MSTSIMSSAPHAVQPLGLTSVPPAKEPTDEALAAIQRIKDKNEQIKDANGHAAALAAMPAIVGAAHARVDERRVFTTLYYFIDYFTDVELAAIAPILRPHLRECAEHPKKETAESYRRTLNEVNARIERYEATTDTALTEPLFP